jgi:phosphatidylglycerophosphate synthase
MFNYITQPHTFLHVIPRMCSTLIVRSIAGTNITPNQITVLRAVFNLLALIFFIAGDYISLILAFCAFQINEILDHVDGDLARFKNMQSKKGLFLEYLVDVPGSTTYGLFGLSVTIGIYRTSHDINIFYIFIAGLMAFAIKETYANLFLLKENMQGFQQAKYTCYKNTSKTSITDRIYSTLKTLLIWRNQLILWAALLYRPVEILTGINPLFWSMVFMSILTGVSLLKTIYKGYKNI